MLSVIQKQFNAFVEFYKGGNRDRFKLSERERFDKLTRPPYPPDEFFWTSEPESDHDCITVGWKEGYFKHRITLPLYRTTHYKQTGKLVFGDLAVLGDKLEGLHPNLADATVALTEFGDDPDDLVLLYTLDPQGVLIYFKLTRAEGLMQVMAKLED